MFFRLWIVITLSFFAGAIAIRQRIDYLGLSVCVCVLVFKVRPSWTNCSNFCGGRSWKCDSFRSSSGAEICHRELLRKSRNASYLLCRVCRHFFGNVFVKVGGFSLFKHWPTGLYESATTLRRVRQRKTKKTDANKTKQISSPALTSRQVAKFAKRCDKCLVQAFGKRSRDQIWNNPLKKSFPVCVFATARLVQACVEVNRHR